MNNYNMYTQVFNVDEQKYEDDIIIDYTQSFLANFNNYSNKRRRLNMNNPIVIQNNEKCQNEINAINRSINQNLRLIDIYEIQKKNFKNPNDSLQIADLDAQIGRELEEINEFKRRLKIQKNNLII